MRAADAVRDARAAQATWRETTTGERLAVIRRLRHAIAADPRALARAAARPQASEADVLVAEIVPLLEACRFLEREAAKVLAPRHPGSRGRPLWLIGTRLEIRRVPFGVMLVLGPGNYPLFLPAVQALQALVAGNAVVVKPALGYAAPMTALGDRLVAAGLPRHLFAVLGDGVEDGRAAVAADIDKVILTGGAETGRAVLTGLAPRLLPSAMELSGRDTVIVLPGADLDLVSQAVAYGLSLNGGATCIAPHRIVAVANTRDALRPLLAARLEEALARPAPPMVIAAARALVGRERDVLGRREAMTDEAMAPLVVAGDPAAPPPGVFGPIADLVAVADEMAAVDVANAGPYALGACVFGPAAAAARVVSRLRAGCVVVNDMIVPTADPRLPFGGTGDSGFGVTRGREGLLECTRVQAVVTRTRLSTRHLRALGDGAAPLVARLLAVAHGDRATRWRGLRGRIER